ncbi:hypothetical protein FACS1894105_07580 [Clostridia bacterium]|nr:hypothetical protein FACS1894105_07580 [Clostridia bacterium]
MTLIKQFDKIRLKNGKKACIVEVLGDGAAFIVDYIGDDGDTEMADITPDDIQSIISEVELPFIHKEQRLLHQTQHGT